MNNYEIIFMLKHESSLREVQRISNYYNNIIKSNYGKIIDIEYDYKNMLDKLC